MTKVLIAESYPLLAGSLSRIIDDDNELQCVGTVSAASDVPPAARSTAADILLIDLTLSGASVIDLISRLRREIPLLRICVLAIQPNTHGLAKAALHAGAAGLVSGQTSPEGLHEAIHRLSSGARYIDPAIVEDFLDDLFPDTVHSATPKMKLSDRELAVLRLLATGRSTNEIADILSLSIKTIGTYKSRLYQKLHTHSVAALVRYAIDHGIAAE